MAIFNSNQTSASLLGKYAEEKYYKVEDNKNIEKYLMISDEQVISVEKVNQLSDFKLEVEFNDKTRQVIDFYPFLSLSRNPLIRRYLSPEEFSKFEIDEGDLEWNDYDLCFPISDLYKNRIVH